MEFIRAKKPTLSLDMAPLIDIVFQLLIFFMLTSAFTYPALKLNLPQAVEQDPRERENIIVSIEKSGSVYLNSETISMESLEVKLRERFSKNPGKKSIHLRGDEEISYKLFIQAMDAARRAGAKQVNVVHKAGKP